MKQPTTVATAEDNPNCASQGLLAGLVRFLEDHGEDFLSWRDGCIVVETYYDKKFRALGGDTNRLISFFEDYCNMHDAARHYIAALKASNAELCGLAAKMKGTQ